MKKETKDRSIIKIFIEEVRILKGLYIWIFEYIFLRPTNGLVHLLIEYFNKVLILFFFKYEKLLKINYIFIFT